MRSTRVFTIVRLGTVLAAHAAAAAAPADAQALLKAPTHLGVAGTPEWDTFAATPPSGESLALTFEARANGTEYTLLVRQQDVKATWQVDLNGRGLGTLVQMEADLVDAISVPAGVIRDGANTLRISSRTPTDDIVIAAIELVPMARPALLTGASLQVRVEGEDRRLLPARVTIVDESGALAALQSLAGATQAARHGVVYPGLAPARVGLRPGRYRVRATRGPEYGTQETTVTLRKGDAQEVVLRLAREVPTPGWVATDTHIHTREVSGHGDASLEERALTLAGEGVELAIATEHDRPTDYAPALGSTGLSAWVTPVVGSEVTTRTGHFNVFPATSAPGAGAAAPEAVTGPVTVLNHPHDVHNGFTPFGPSTFNTATGDSRGLPRTFTAVEVANSGAMRSDWMEPVRSWFALLNRGRRVTPIGASDSHDVSRFIVGQGRTYVRAPDTDVGRLPVDEAVESLRAGRVVVSLGLFAQARIGTAGPGDLVRVGTARTIEAEASGATWIRADRLALFVNGVEAASARIEGATQAQVEKVKVRWPLPRRRYDYFVVVIASGPGVTDPSWAIAAPYQPSSPTRVPMVFALTAPIYVDADGDGTFSSARDYASRLVEAHGTSLRVLFRALADHDAVVSSHAAELLEERGVELSSDEVRAALRHAAAPVREGITRYLAAK